MTTPLGYTSAGLLSQAVANTSATLIPQGAVCSLTFGSAATLIGADQILVEAIVAAASPAVHHVGIAATAIPAGGKGTVIQMGCCLVKTTSAALAIGVAIKVETNGHQVLAQGGSGTIIGVSLEAKHTAYTSPDFGSNTQGYAYCWVNFISSASFGWT